MKISIRLFLLVISPLLLPSCFNSNQKQEQPQPETEEQTVVIQPEIVKNEITHQYTYNYDDLAGYDSIVVNTSFLHSFMSEQVNTSLIKGESGIPGEFNNLPPLNKAAGYKFYKAGKIEYPDRSYYSLLFIYAKESNEYTEESVGIIWLVNYHKTNGQYIDSRRIYSSLDSGTYELDFLYSVYYPKLSRVDIKVHFGILGSMEDQYSYHTVQTIIHPSGKFEDDYETPYSQDSVTINAGYDRFAIQGKFPAGEKWMGLDFKHEEYEGHGARIAFYESLTGLTDLEGSTTKLKQIAGDSIYQFHLAFRGDFENAPAEIEILQQERISDYPGLKEAVIATIPEPTGSEFVTRLRSYTLDDDKYMFAYVQTDRNSPNREEHLVGISPDMEPVYLAEPNIQYVYVFRIGECTKLFVVNYRHYIPYRLYDLDEGFKEIGYWFLTD